MTWHKVITKLCFSRQSACKYISILSQVSDTLGIMRIEIDLNRFFNTLFPTKIMKVLTAESLQRHWDFCNIKYWSKVFQTEKGLLFQYTLYLVAVIWSLSHVTSKLIDMYRMVMLTWLFHINQHWWNTPAVEVTCLWNYVKQWGIHSRVGHSHLIGCQSACY